MSSKKFTIEKVEKGAKGAPSRKQRGEALVALFAEFGLKGGKLFSTDVIMTTMSFEDNGVKVVFNVAGIMDNTMLAISIDKMNRVILSVGKEMDFEKVKEPILTLYHMEYTRAAEKAETEKGVRAMVDRLAPYTKEITMLASKQGFQVEFYEKPNSVDMCLTVHAIRKATLKFNGGLRFESVAFFPDSEPIEGFDYAYYEAKVAEMKKAEALCDEINLMLSKPPVAANAEQTA